MWVHTSVSISFNSDTATAAKLVLGHGNHYHCSCAGAGNHPIKLIKSVGFKLMRSNPAAAKTAPAQSLSCNFCHTVFDISTKVYHLMVGIFVEPFGLGDANFRCGDGTASLLEKSKLPLKIKISKVFARSKTAFCTMPCGNAVDIFHRMYRNIDLTANHSDIKFWWKFRWFLIRIAVCPKWYPPSDFTAIICFVT